MISDKFTGPGMLKMEVLTEANVYVRRNPKKLHNDYNFS